MNARKDWKVNQQMAILATCLLVMTGCANMKEVVRHTHETLMTITTLAEINEVEEVNQLYSIEERIIDSCKPLLDSVRIIVDGGQIPLFTMLDSLLSVDDCRKTVEATQQELALLNVNE